MIAKQPRLGLFFIVFGPTLGEALYSEYNECNRSDRKKCLAQRSGNNEIATAKVQDIPEIYQLQLLAFESEAAMIGSRDVPALQETEEVFRRDFSN